METRNIYNQRVTQKQKDADDKNYYREQLDLLDSRAFSRNYNFLDNNITEYKRKKVNYELFNNRLNLEDFSYVCQPFGAEVGELPAQMANRDIISGKIKALVGMEAKRSFTWKVLAINEDATSRKEKEKFNRIKQFVIAQIMLPIQQSIEQKYQEQTKGKPLSPDEKQQLQSQIASEVQSQTPPEVMKYMSREYADPAEVLSRQIMKYLMQKEKIEDKFLKGFKHGCISGEEIYWVGLIHNEPALRVINSLYFDHSKAPDSEYVEDSEWGVVELRMTMAEILAQFRDELEDEEIDELYETYPVGSPTQIYDLNADFFLFEDGRYDNTIRVIYAEWKGERKVGFLSVINEDGELDTVIVDENYKLNESQGDVEIDWQWIPEVHHGYKIGSTIYKGMGAIPGQHRDLDNLDECKLRFVGVTYDNMNSHVTSLVDRMKAYQYYYNIIMYRIELLMAADKGKILMMNIKSIPRSAGIDTKKFMHFLEANKIGFFNPNEEGNKGSGSVGDIAKEVDMSLVSDISKYIEFAEYIEKRCGDSVGITDNIEGQTAPTEAVRNAQSNLMQSANILEPYFNLHNQVKRNVLQRLIETAQVGYAQGKPRKLAYMLDDLSQELLNIDEANQELLEDSTLGIFVGDSTADNDAKMLVQQLAHAAMQTQQVDLLDIVKVLRADDVQQAEENLEVGVQRQQQLEQQQQSSQQTAQAQEAQAQREHEQEQWAHDKDMITLKAQLERETKVEVATISAMGFAKDTDTNQDGQPDVLEVADQALNAHIKLRQQALDEKIANQNKDTQDKKIEVDKQKVAAMKQKKVAAK